MSKSYKNTYGGTKVLKPYAVSRLFSFSFYLEERQKVKAKGGAILEGEEELFMNVVNGHFKQGIPKSYRKVHNREQKCKMKQKFLRQVRDGDFESIGGDKYIKNAGHFYY